MNASKTEEAKRSEKLAPEWRLFFLALSIIQRTALFSCLLPNGIVKAMLPKNPPA